MKLNFDDNYCKRGEPLSKSLPQPEHLEKLDAFLDSVIDYPNPSIIFHCTAGISRSTACALYFILKTNDGWIHKAYETLVSIRREALPNYQIVRYIDDKLGFNGELIEYSKSRERNMIIKGLEFD